MYFGVNKLWPQLWGTKDGSVSLFPKDKLYIWQQGKGSGNICTRIMKSPSLSRNYAFLLLSVSIREQNGTCNSVHWINQEFEIDITMDISLNSVRPLQFPNFWFSGGDKRTKNLFPIGSNFSLVTLELGCSLRSNASLAAAPKTKSSSPERNLWLRVSHLQQSAGHCELLFEYCSVLYVLGNRNRIEAFGLNLLFLCDKKTK